jgi:site-specific DNA recombinase
VSQNYNCPSAQAKADQNQINNIIDTIASGMFHPSMKEKMDTLEDEKAKYESKIAELQLKLKNYKNINKDKIVLFLESNKCIKNKSLDMQKHIVQTFIKEVLIYERHC